MFLRVKNKTKQTKKLTTYHQTKLLLFNPFDIESYPVLIIINRIKQIFLGKNLQQFLFQIRSELLMIQNRTLLSIEVLVFSP